MTVLSGSSFPSDRTITCDPGIFLVWNHQSVLSAIFSVSSSFWRLLRPISTLNPSGEVISIGFFPAFFLLFCMLPPLIYPAAASSSLISRRSSAVLALSSSSITLSMYISSCLLSAIRSPNTAAALQLFLYSLKYFWAFCVTDSEVSRGTRCSLHSGS